jgi:hypothetical protein
MLRIPFILWGDAPKHTVTVVGLSPDGEHLVTGSREGRLCIWDVKQVRAVL